MSVLVLTTLVGLTAVSVAGWWLRGPILPGTALVVLALSLILAAAAGPAPHGIVVSAAVLGVLAAAAGGGPLTVAVLALARRDGAAEPGPEAPGSEPGPSAAPRPARVLRGGTWIGVLERLATIGALLAGLPEGLAVVLAVKGLARYPELREDGGAVARSGGLPGATRSGGISEEFIIGTFTSVLWAAGVAACIRLLAA